METNQDIEKVKVQLAIDCLDSAFKALNGIDTYLVVVKCRIIECAALLGHYRRNLYTSNNGNKR